ncbi:MAG TPA: mucoidy inhibitor MuiA family protein [Myxococcales bacterium]|nr:mucoidy inhibitor MuiA family protein [Myxococcales bacterium]
MIPLALAAIDAPVREVTVYSDRARVARVATVNVNGAQAVELPLLLETVDTSTLRVEAQGAEVRRVDVDFVDAADVPADEAKALLQKLEGLDDQIALAGAQRSASQAQLQALDQIRPTMPPADPLKPAPKLQPSGWVAALGVVDDAGARQRQKIAELDLKLEALRRERDAVARQAAILGGAERKAGYRVKVFLDGHGAAKLTATYVVGRARWYPTYDIQYLPKSGQVQISFTGLVSQESGEDWNDAQLVLSTAVPAAATVLPRLLSWKIGERERFIPTPYAPVEPPKPPPPPYPPQPEDERAQTLRSRLLAAAGRPAPAKATSGKANGATTIDFEDDVISGDLQRPPSDAVDYRRNAPAAPPPPPPRPSRGGKRAEMPAAAPAQMAARPSAKDEEYVEEIVVTGSRMPRSATREQAPPPMAVGGLGPPPSYQAPSFQADLPAAAAGGYDLFYKSARPETVGSGQGARRVALFAQGWPVTVERKVFPALVPEAFLVAEIKNPSSQPLPAGSANLFVGEDPAGTAKLKLVAPGEQFTLPLGLDRAIRAVRNVRLVQTETGFLIGKEELTEYVVTIELANPYSIPVPITVVDQVPVVGDKDKEARSMVDFQKLEVKLLKTSPAVTRKDDVKGQLEWKLTLPAGGKSVVSFNYTLKRPKGWRLYQ